eukprot:GSMAST32.ASY1.ANO1.2268.1 assembled CDS
MVLLLVFHKNLVLDLKRKLKNLHHWYLQNSTKIGKLRFVNKMASLRGGTHVTAIADLVCKPIADAINVYLRITPGAVRQNLKLFVNAKVANPSFDSQSKEMLTTKLSALNIPKLSPKVVWFIFSISNFFFFSFFLSIFFSNFSKSRQKAMLYKKTKVSKNRMLTIPKLSDANLAGGRRSSECTLILTEGDSAKAQNFVPNIFFFLKYFFTILALAVSGLSVIGRDTYGVFPLKGKLLNVRTFSL